MAGGVCRLGFPSLVRAHMTWSRPKIPNDSDLEEWSHCIGMQARRLSAMASCEIPNDPALAAIPKDERTI